MKHLNTLCGQGQRILLLEQLIQTAFSVFQRVNVFLNVHKLPVVIILTVLFISAGYDHYKTKPEPCSRNTALSGSSV